MHAKHLKIPHKWEATWKYLLNIKIHLPFYTAIPLQGVYPSGTLHT